LCPTVSLLLKQMGWSFVFAYMFCRTIITLSRLLWRNFQTPYPAQHNTNTCSRWYNECTVLQIFLHLKKCFCGRQYNNIIIMSDFKFILFILSQYISVVSCWWSKQTFTLAYSYLLQSGIGLGSIRN
jgi:hypothetical protein